MKALKEGWIVSDAERKMIEIQENIALTEQRAFDVKEQAATRIALRVAAQDVHAQDRRGEEIRLGWDVYEAAGSKQREDWRRTYKATPAGKLTLRRLGIDPAADITEPTIEKYPDLKNGLAGYVFNKAKASKTKTH